LKRKAAEKKFNFAYLADEGSSAARSFGATKTPEVFLFNGEDKLVYHGSVDDNYEDAGSVEKHFLKDAIAQLLENRKIATAETKSIGCSIKFYN